MSRRFFIAFVFALAALPLAGPAAAAPRLLIGAADDGPKQMDPIVAKTKMDMAKLTGMNAIRLTSTWKRGQIQPEPVELLSLQNAATAANLDGITVYVSVLWFNRNTPLRDVDRTQFAQYTASLARELPTVKRFIVGNEPNYNLFWLPQYDAAGRDVAAIGYQDVLAKTYDALKQVSPEIEVVGGALCPTGFDDRRAGRPTHSPTQFILDLGRAYRASGRTQPIMDSFAMHPYLTRSKFAPTKTHPRSKIIALADYGKLVSLLGRAFNGTAQRGSALPVVYDEFGVQSQIPNHKVSSYSNISAPAASDAVSESVQAKYYAQALQIAYCQRNVTGMLLFLLADEPDLSRWQSGLYYTDGTPKSGVGIFKRAATAATGGKLRCAAKPKAKAVRKKARKRVRAHGSRAKNAKKAKRARAKSTPVKPIDVPGIPKPPSQPPREPFRPVGAA